MSIQQPPNMRPFKRALGFKHYNTYPSTINPTRGSHSCFSRCWSADREWGIRGRKLQCSFLVKSKSQTWSHGSFCLISLLQAFFFNLCTCQDSDQQLYCRAVSRITHVNTQGVFAASGTIDVLATALCVLLSRDEFGGLDCHTVECSCSASF